MAQFCDLQAVDSSQSPAELSRRQRHLPVGHRTTFQSQRHLPTNQWTKKEVMNINEKSWIINELVTWLNENDVTRSEGSFDEGWWLMGLLMRVDGWWVFGWGLMVGGSFDEGWWLMGLLMVERVLWWFHDLLCPRWVKVSLVTDVWMGPSSLTRLLLVLRPGKGLLVPVSRESP